MRADDLSPGVWNGIAEEINRAQSPREIVFGKVVKRDTVNKLIWLESFGNLAIPLVSFGFGFSYYDTDQLGTVNKRDDPSGTNPALQTKLLVPSIGETAVILNPGGQHRFPLCVGVVRSTRFWTGEG
jgi:hypothetical protein